MGVVGSFSLKHFPSRVLVAANILSGKKMGDTVTASVRQIFAY